VRLAVIIPASLSCQSVLFQRLVLCIPAAQSINALWNSHQRRRGLSRINQQYNCRRWSVYDKGHVPKVCVWAGYGPVPHLLFDAQNRKDVFSKMQIAFLSSVHVETLSCWIRRSTALRFLNRCSALCCVRPSVRPSLGLFVCLSVCYTPVLWLKLRGLHHGIGLRGRPGGLCYSYLAVGLSSAINCRLLTVNIRGCWSISNEKKHNWK